jgi:hypothetical protein
MKAIAEWKKNERNPHLKDEEQLNAQENCHSSPDRASKEVSNKNKENGRVTKGSHKTVLEAQKQRKPNSNLTALKNDLTSNRATINPSVIKVGPFSSETMTMGTWKIYDSKTKIRKSTEGRAINQQNKNLTGPSPIISDMNRRKNHESKAMVSYISCNDTKRLNGDKEVILGLSTLINTFSHASTKPHFAYLQNVVSAKNCSKRAKVKSFDVKNGNTPSLSSISNQIQVSPSITPRLPVVNSWIESDACIKKDKRSSIYNNLGRKGKNTITRFPSLPSIQDVQSEVYLDTAIASKNSKNERNPQNKLYDAGITVRADHVTPSDNYCKRNKKAGVRGINSAANFTNIPRIASSYANHGSDFDNLNTILKSHDCRLRNNITAIADPIRKCNNILCIHEGDARKREP